MLRIRIEKLLEERGKSKYWLYHRITFSGYRSFDNLVKGKTRSVRFEILEQLHDLFECSYDELFEHVEDDTCDKDSTLKQKSE